MSILATPYVLAGTVSLILGYKTYNSYYNQPFEYLEIEGLQNENKEKPQEDDIIKEEELIQFPSNSPSPPSPSPPSPPPSPPPQSPIPQINKVLPKIYVDDKLVKKNEITNLHKPVIVMETISEEKIPEQKNILRRRNKKYKKRKN